MKKSSTRKTINEMRHFAKAMPTTINEMINFEGEDEGMPFNDEEDEIEPHKEIKDEGNFDVMQFVDDIRKKSLKGMAALAENPDDERYQLLKKIWQICDKKPEQQTAFNNPNQMQGQGQGQMQGQQMMQKPM